MARRATSGGGRLSVDDWIQAGFAIVAEEGIRALKLERVCAYLGVTRGSFYWHFDDMASYRAALVSSWGELRDTDRQVFARLREMPPRERLSAMVESFITPRHWTLERVMREWGRTDRAVASSVRAADKRVLNAARDTFRDLGFPPEEADTRAKVFFATGVGLLHLSDPRPDRATVREWEQFVDFMVKR
ncbi:TetR/AcrR family transcriptional regulator [Mycobacterium sp. 2YAF39]|uniref:TetR/AcrR family transcriptional regulator n=1 Tax=Mycobacterium sp. 2YAF39 TaxID=3233033 RepID=UPI003F9754EC